MANEIQTITFSATPVGGDWTITFNGFTTDAIGYGYSVGVVEDAIQALVSVNGDVTVTGSIAGGLTVEFINALGNTNVPQMTVYDTNLLQAATTINVTRSQAGVASSPGQVEIQTLTISGADGGTFSVEGNYYAWDIAGNTISIPGVTVSGGSGSPLVFTWNTEGAQNYLSVNGDSLTSGGVSGGSLSLVRTQTGYSGSPGTQEIQVVTLADNPTSGSWGQSSALAYNASASAVESSLESQTGQGLSVSGSDGGPYTVTWDSAGSQSLLSISGGNLAKGGITATVTTTQQGSAASGSSGNLIILGVG